MTQLQVSYSFYKHHTPEEGVILRIEDYDGNFGVANLHPHTQLGDLTLSNELRTKGPLYQRAMELALDDLYARTQKRFLYNDQPVLNHILIQDWKKFDAQLFSNDEVYKFKCGPDFVDFANWLNFNELKFAKIRIDFNAKLNAQQFKHFLSLLQPNVIQKIDVIEDPTRFDFNNWTEFSKQVRIASDFEKMEYNSKGWPVRVNKPSREPYDASSEYITSSMDHPIGHVHAMRFAQLHPQAKHGFLTIQKYCDSEYFADFSITAGKIQYLGKGFGIGFETQLAKENYIPEVEWNHVQESQLILDPSLSIEMRSLAFTALKAFKVKHPNDYILIASSGSTVSSNEIKIYAFTKKAFLSAAERVIQHFEIPKNLRWGCVLPFYHVAGLSVLARAFLTESELVVNTWRNVTQDWFTEKKIQAISLIPAQIFDIVQKGWLAPSSLKFVFVGAGQLSPEIFQKALSLGWPLRLTYGMTETIGMIAEVKTYEESDPIYTFMHGVMTKPMQPSQVQVSSQAEFKILVRADQISIQTMADSDGFIDLPDRIEWIDRDHFKLVGRIDEQIKIKGELVHLAKIKRAIVSSYHKNFELLAFEHPRNGYHLVIVFEQNESEVLRIELQNMLKNLNSQLRPHEQIKSFAFISEFPKSSLLKNRTQEIKVWIEQNAERGRIYEVGKF